MPLYRVRAPASSRMIYQCDIICILVMPKKLKTVCLLILIDLKFIGVMMRLVILGCTPYDKGYISQTSNIKVDCDETPIIRDNTSQFSKI
ncbi:hypothetical protein T05_15785 [Trichinella murrelli]|uniref:Uncharacterized protein n=1 Tax=Trichinella murrelli TaxID=144512 RepID=A0A0V0T073_9BILA|nr:hypothetical protein T05_15785 [Trichinella murrelli]